VGQTKTIIIVDADQDLRDDEGVWFRVGAYSCPDRDYLFAEGLARDDDYTAGGVATRVGIDATRKRIGETSQPWPRELQVSDEIKNRIRDRWQEYGLRPL
jgi:4-hydroxy-3-polyprenylbenzoate decarboxylase